jgi:hypothetical protein
MKKFSMKKLFIISYLLFIPIISFAQQNEISNALKNSDYKQLANYFSSNVEINIVNNEGLYSKNQAEMILKDFFQKNIAISFNSKDGSKYSIGSLETSNGNYKTYFFLKKEGEVFLVNELRIEKDK